MSMLSMDTIMADHVCLLVSTSKSAITRSNPAKINRLKDEMKAQFLMTNLELPSCNLGNDVSQDAKGITLNQKSYVTRILDTTRMKCCNPAPATMEECLKLRHERTMDKVDSTMY